MSKLVSRLLFGKELAERIDILKHSQTSNRNRRTRNRHEKEVSEVQHLMRREFLKRFLIICATASGGVGVYNSVGESDDNLDLCGFKFTFDEDFTKERISHVRNIIETAIPELIKYIPSREDVGKPIFVKKTSSPTHKSQASYHTGEFNIDEKGSDGLVVHELVHLFHGDRDLYVDFIEEGLATAISILVAESVGLESWDTVKDIQLNSTLSNGGMSVLNNVPYDYYAPLSALRYYMAAKLWLDLERQHPGFIREFHELYYDYLDKGGSKGYLGGQAGLDIVRKIGGNIFDKISMENPIMRHEKTSVAERKLLYVHYVHFKSGDRSVILNFVMKNQDGAEKPIGGRSVGVRFMNADNGVISRSVSFYTQPNGEVNMPLNKGESGHINLESELGYASSYKVFIEVDDIQEEFEFFYR